MSWHLLRPSGRKTRKAPVFLAVMLATVVTASAMAAVPDNTSAPTINGTARDGQTLTATNGTWANSPTSFRYQWQRCSATGTDCAGIVSATNQSYTPVAATSTTACAWSLPRSTPTVSRLRSRGRPT